MSKSPLDGAVGIAVNPASGKDIRRLVAKASVFDNQEKLAIVRRAAIGAVAAGANEFHFVRDSHGIAEIALRDIEARAKLIAVDSSQTSSELDTIAGARALKRSGCRVNITLGGDGTNRAFVKGWRHAPLIPISTGTNNVFPELVEATIAGAAAGLIVTGAVTLAQVAKQVKLIDIQVQDEPDDLALIDAVLTNDRFIGARALLDGSQLNTALLTKADPAVVGVASIGGLLSPVGESDDCGLMIRFGSGGRTIRAPIAPGLYQSVHLAEHRRVAVGEPVEIEGPGVLALDGERQRVLKPGQKATMRVSRDGPFVVNINKTLALGASTFILDSKEK